MPVDPTQGEEVGLGQISDSVVADNLKTIAGASAFYSTLAMGNAVSHQKRTDILAEALLGRAARSIVEEDPTEAASVQKILTGNDIAQQMQALSASVSNSLGQLAAAIASIQQNVKAAQTTPPNTAG